MATATTKKFYEYQEEKMVPAGLIERHPDVQRNTPGPARWARNCGTFSAEKANLQNLVLVKRSDGKKGYYAINGATRAEMCPDKKTPLRALILGNGRPGTTQELAEALLVTNTDHNRVSGGFALQTSVGQR